ncbi:MAG: hypothetical protein IKE24_02325 [Clostridia bacterium]|nr:hypothetical protein [Clostridia bacterium]
MLSSIGYFLCFQALGVLNIRWLLPGRRPLDRLWLGMSLGLLEMTWLPALFAFATAFDAAAHWMAMGAGALLSLGCFFLRDRRAPKGWDEKETQLMRQMLAVALPLTILGGYLQYTHNMRVDAWGNWNVGQSTYGDLPMHMSFVTGLVGKRFPADYPFYPGTRLSYPFLTDSLSASFYLMGSGLQAALIVPGTFMMALCFTGVLILGREMTAGRKTAALAALLFFLNGGLGFLYDFDQAAGYDPDGSLTVVGRLRAIMEGYYKTPTNQPEPNNLRWSNVIADLMVPQRTLLGGWAMGIPCFYLLETLFRPERTEGKGEIRGLILLGIWAGSLPLIHTHTFLALGLGSLGVMGYDLIHGGKKKGRPRGRTLGRYAVYGGLALAAALPQLIGFTFAQTFQGEAATHSFLTFQFNWVNNPGGGGMRDFYLWFYVKNIGLPFLMMLFAIFDRDPRQRRLFAQMLPIVIAAELIRFQPNEYDNNKLFYLAWMLGCMIAANFARKAWTMLKGLPGRRAMAAVTGAVIFLSPALTLARETVSTYQAFSAAAVEAGMYIRDHTPADAVFLTGTQHLNPVDSIAGRTIVCGPDLWLYWHGFDTTERKADLERFYEDPAGNRDVIEKYGAAYIYVSSYERSSYEVDEEALAALYTPVFENGEAALYQVSP